MKSRVLIYALIVTLAACGRSLPPLPPELLAPAEVQYIEVIPAAESVTLRWRAPQNDVRGEDLKSIEGYEVLRAVATDEADRPSSLDDFVQIGFVEDLHLLQLDALRAEARAERRPLRKVKLPDEATLFSFTDEDLERDRSYTYLLIPRNQGGTQGAIRQQIRLRFNGEESVAAVTPFLEGDGDLHATTGEL